MVQYSEFMRFAGCSAGGPWSDQPVMEFFKSILEQTNAGQPAGRIVDSMSELAK